MSLNTNIRNTQSIEDLVRLLADAFRTGMAPETAWEIETALERMINNPVCKTHGSDLECVKCLGPDICDECKGDLECPKCNPPAHK